MPDNITRLQFGNRQAVFKAGRDRRSVAQRDWAVLGGETFAVAPGKPRTRSAPKATPAAAQAG